MNRLFQFCIVINLMVSMFFTHALGENLVFENFSEENLRQHLQTTAKCIENSPYDINWNQINEADKQQFVNEAESVLGEEVPPIPASLLLEYTQNGNRSNLEAAWMSRRSRLVSLVIAEKIEMQGRFMSDIVDLIWAICEESTWVIPAHYYQYSQVGLPDVTIDYVDLFAGETGAQLAWVHHLLKDELDKVSPMLDKRILTEIHRRILIPNLASQDYHWMGYKDEKLNNWTPWISSNWLTCVMLCEEDSDKKVEAISKIMLLLNRYLSPYNADGGCDEGPLYWNLAGGSLFDCLVLLEMVTDGYISVWNNQLVRNIGSYISKVHLSDNYFVNFADASPIVVPDPILIYRYGQKIGDESMIRFAIQCRDKTPISTKFISHRFNRLLPRFTMLSEIKEYNVSVEEVTESYFPDMEVAVFGMKKSESCFQVAAKGGHNNESHNHNDVGQFIVFYNGYPLLIDVGVETYTQKTFSNQRYDIWTMQSQYHNLPTINGVMQKAGAEYKASDVFFENNASEGVFSLDIKNAYPDAAQVIFWKRSVVLDKEHGTVDLTEDFSLSGVDGKTEFHFMCDKKPQWKANQHEIVLTTIDGDKVALSIPEDCTVNIESCDTSDPRVQKDWGDEVYRITVSPREIGKDGKYIFQLSKH